MHQVRALGSVHVLHARPPIACPLPSDPSPDQRIYHLSERALGRSVQDPLIHALTCTYAACTAFPLKGASPAARREAPKPTSSTDAHTCSRPVLPSDLGTRPCRLSASVRCGRPGVRSSGDGEPMGAETCRTGGCLMPAGSGSL
jgi:hypothetical protein